MITQQYLNAESLAQFLPQEIISSLLAEEDLRGILTGKNLELSLIPKHSDITLVTANLITEKPDVIVEALFFWKKPFNSENEILLAYNIFRAIGSLQGIEYYSASRKKMRLFYEKSYIITGPEEKTPIADAQLEKIPASETLWSFQKDLTFGENKYRYNFYTGKNFIYVESTNITPLSYGFIPVVAREKMKNRIFTIFTDEGIIFWICSSANASIIPGMKSKLADSFGNRAKALFTWFSGKSTEAWSKEK